jgi:hypothetical protein
VPGIAAELGLADRYPVKQLDTVLRRPATSGKSWGDNGQRPSTDPKRFFQLGRDVTAERRVDRLHEHSGAHERGGACPRSRDGPATSAATGIGVECDNPAFARIGVRDTDDRAPSSGAREGTGTVHGAGEVVGDDPYLDAPSVRSTAWTAAL